MWVTKLLISPLKIRIFAQKRPNLVQNWHFCQFGPGHAGLFSALLVGGCGARAVSRKTPIHFIHIDMVYSSNGI